MVSELIIDSKSNMLFKDFNKNMSYQTCEKDFVFFIQKLIVGGSQDLSK